VIKQAVDAKKEKLSLPKASVDTLYKALINDQTVQLTLGLQQILTPEAGKPEVAPAAAPEKKVEKK